MAELNCHIQSEHKDKETLIQDVDIINAEVLIEYGDGLNVQEHHQGVAKNESILKEGDIEHKSSMIVDGSNNIVEENPSILEEEVIENDNHIMLDDFNIHVEENPDIDTLEVLIQCEASDDTSNEITLVMEDENDNPVFCPLCKNGFLTPEVLTEHLSHHPSCPTCSLRVLSSSSLSQHLSTHPQCGICGDRFTDIDLLEKHEKNHADIEQAIRDDSHSIVSKYQNPEIRDAISSIQSAPVVVKDDFIDGRKSAELIQEVNPGYTIDNLDVGRDLDIASLLAKQNIRAQCDLCEKTFSNETVLDMHMQGAHAGYIEPIQNQESPRFQMEILEIMMICNFCQESFISTSELNRHTAAVHTEILEANQTVSGPASEQVSSQEQVAVREIAPPFNCTICKDAFVKVGQLSKHFNIYHKISMLESGKPFQCKICNSNFLQLSTLDKHLQVEPHGQEFSFDCPECSKTFKYSASLEQHLRTHSSVKPFQCSSCTRTFNWEASIRMHIKKCKEVLIDETVKVKKTKVAQKPEVRIEVGVGAESLTVKCSRCGEDLRDQGQLSGHTCPGDRGKGRRFRCSGCQMLFRSRREVKRHLKGCDGIINQEGDEVKDVPGHRVSRRLRKVVKDDLFVSDIEGSDKEEEEHKDNENEGYSESSDDEGSSGNEQDDFSTEPSMKRYKVEKIARKTHICNYCERIFKSGGHLKEHLICHTGVYPINCDECGRGFRRKFNLEQHKCSNPGNKKRRVSVIQKTPGDIGIILASPTLLGKSPRCKDLSEKLKVGKDLHDHREVMEDPLTGLFSCSVCQYSTDDGMKFNQHLQSGVHARRGQMVEFNSSQAKYKCELCFFKSDSMYSHKRHIGTKKHLEKEETRTEEEILDKLNNPKIYTCLVCEKQFKDLVSLDEHVEEHKKSGTKEAQNSEPELTSRSGRKIKPKKFHDDSSANQKRKLGDGLEASNLVKKPRRSRGLNTSQDSCVSKGVECGSCGDNFLSHTAHFTHMLSHVPPEIVKTLPVVEGGGVGWCPHCPGPVQLEMVEQHMVESHQDMEEEEEAESGLKIGEKKLEFDEIDPEELEALDIPDSERCVPKRYPG
eukprot:GFUD01021665.1.p1 GENE.GFUD01021665.1~~GFUD01021665.1.p1  ORF type:complete len:1180 (+),score=324.74 GFUD01021665.1:293-3541(+)